MPAPVMKRKNEVEPSKLKKKKKVSHIIDNMGNRSNVRRQLFTSPKVSDPAEPQNKVPGPLEFPKMPSPPQEPPKKQEVNALPQVESLKKPEHPRKPFMFTLCHRCYVEKKCHAKIHSVTGEKLTILIMCQSCVLRNNHLLNV